MLVLSSLTSVHKALLIEEEVVPDAASYICVADALCLRYALI